MIKRGISVLILIFLLLSLGYFMLLLFGGRSVHTFTFEKKNLKTVVEQQINNTDSRFGIFIKNLSTGETFASGEQEIFEAGSLYKLWVMGTTFEEIKEGKIKEDDLLIANVAALNKKFDLNGDGAELQEGRIEFSVTSALHQMITISHNYAALALLDKVGSSKVSGFLKKYGFGKSSMGNPPGTSVKNIASFFEKIYKGEMIDQQYSQKMMDLLAKQTINDRIPKYLPEGTKIAHKTGDLGFFEHDAGIVFSPGGDFIIVVLTETKDPSQASDTIAKISQAAYKYFNETSTESSKD